MAWWQTLLMTAGSCFITLLVTFIFNWVSNRPKVRKEKEEKEKAQKKQELLEFKEEIKKSVEEVRSEANKQSNECQKDHQCLAKIVTDIQQTNMAQNKGLQAVLRDLLKIRYLNWIGKGYAPMDARTDLENMYQAYHGLGANGVLTELRDRFMKLPIDEKESEK